MLKTIIFNFKFFRFIQSGLYLDFLIKKLTEIFVKNYFVYSSHYFGEKYIIEYLTKKIIESWIFNLNKNHFHFNFLNSLFFIQNISFIFIFISLFIIIF